MDEVIADHTGSFNVYHDTKYGTDLQNMDINEFYLRDLIGITAEQEMERIVDYYHGNDFVSMKPIVGSTEAVRKLARDHELYVITSRPDFVAEESKEWLQRYFPDCFKEFVILNHPCGGSKAKKKSEACAEKKIDIMIEDLADYANDCSAVCSRVLLLEKPWNRDKEIASNVTRVHDWSEIVELISGSEV